MCAPVDGWSYHPKHVQQFICVLLLMGGVTTRNMYSSLQKYNKLYIVASCWTIIDSRLMS